MKAKEGEIVLVQETEKDYREEPACKERRRWASFSGLLEFYLGQYVSRCTRKELGCLSNRF